MNGSNSTKRWFRRILMFIFLIAVSAISNALLNPQEKKQHEKANSSFEMQITQHQGIQTETFHFNKRIQCHFPIFSSKVLLPQPEFVQQIRIFTTLINIWLYQTNIQFQSFKWSILLQQLAQHPTKRTITNSAII